MVSSTAKITPVAGSTVSLVWSHALRSDGNTLGTHRPTEKKVASKPSPNPYKKSACHFAPSTQNEIYSKTCTENESSYVTITIKTSIDLELTPALRFDV